MSDDTDNSPDPVPAPNIDPSAYQYLEHGDSTPTERRDRR
jgi:hypothetical protein